MTYRFADGVVAVSDGVAAEVARIAGISRDRVKTICNPVREPSRSAIDPEAQWTGSAGKRVLSVGRFTPQKNHALLIEAFEQLLESQEATLAIVGEGPERSALEKLIQDRGLAHRVHLPGFCATPGDWYAGADLFVLSSDYEGFGNVLVEALHFGLPIVSTDCPFGPAEILGDGKWGRLVPTGDPAALATAMAAALTGSIDNEQQRNRASKFLLEDAADAYEALLFGAKTSKD